MEAFVADRFISLTESAAKRIQTLKETEGNAEMMLRVSVSGGGCSGFSYSFTLDDQVNDDDHTFDDHGVVLVVDDTSLDLLSGATIDFIEDLMGSSFAVRNPNASATCGCGSSFSV